MKSMVKAEMAVHIDRPVGEVFAYMSDLTNVPEWNSMIEEASASESPIKIGTQVHLRQRVLGRRLDTTMTIVEHEPNKRIAYSFDKPLAGRGIETYEPEDQGTRLVQVMEAEAGGFFRIAEPIAARIFQRQQQANLEAVKEILEARVHDVDR
jgi:uncharacterized membrane protein